MDNSDDKNNIFLYHLKKVFDTSVSLSPKLIMLCKYVYYFHKNNNLKHFFKVLFPKISAFLSKKGLVEFFPQESLRFFQDFIDQVIERRKNKLEVISLKFLFNI